MAGELRGVRVRARRASRLGAGLPALEAGERVAEASAESYGLRGDGDAAAAASYAAAYQNDADFYSCVRSLEAYRKTLGENTTMVVSPDHEFFRYLSAGSATR